MQVDLKQFNLKNKTVAVALSGGSDSMALLHYLFTQKDKYNYNVIAINIEHGIRGKDSISDSEFVKEYYVLIMEEYETFFKTYNIRYKYIDVEEDNCILLGHLTKEINYNSSMILDYSFPINYNLSENYNKLMMLIFENINSNEFNFNILNYRFLTL